MRTRINGQTADQWAKCAALWRIATQALDDMEVLLLLEMGQTDGKPMDVLSKAIDSVSGNSYMFTPQPEWTGGDSADPKNTVYVEPHICR